MELTGAQIIVESLIDQGVQVVFGYPGGTVINIYDALYDKQDQIRHILTSHEQGAAHAADGYSRSTGKTGVCLATSGPGATNLVTGLATAYLDSIPLVAITGNVTQDMLGRDSFQEVDIVGVTIPIIKHNYFVNDITKLAEIIREAFVIANSGRPGPVLIDIPKDITAIKAEYVPAGRFQKRAIPDPDPTDLALAADMIRESKRPLVYFGGGVVSGNAGEALQAFCRKLCIPSTSSAMGLSAVPYNFPYYLGLVGMHGTPVANQATLLCDLIITVGARFSDRVTGNKSKFIPEAKVLHIDIDASEVNKNILAHHGVAGDARVVLEKLTAALDPSDDTSWGDELMAYKAAHPLPKETIADAVDPRAILEVIRKMDENTIIVTDVGQHQMITAQNYKFSRPRSFISSCGLGTMGYGVGAANGAQVGNPGSRVALITGDGCFHMNLNELAVAVTEKLPIMIFIMHNGVLGMVRQWQKLFYKQRYSSTTLHRETDFVKIAEAFGATGMRIETPDQIDDVVKAAYEAGGPVVVDCIINEDDDVFPIIPPGGSVKDMIRER